MLDSSALFRLPRALMGLATPASPETKTITGQLIDLGGYAAGHAASDYTGVHARACAMEGFEVGLLTTDGKAYHLTGDFKANNNAKFLPHMLAKSVSVTGDASEKDGQLWLNVTDIQ